jgi:hypothetical protein
MNSNAHVVVEIVNTNNINYLNTEHIDDEIETNYKFTKQFAAGHLFTTSLLDCIICQAFYNPSIVNVMNKLLSGGHEIDHHEMRKTATKKMVDFEEGGGEGTSISSSLSSSSTQQQGRDTTRLSTDSKKLHFAQKLSKAKSVTPPQKVIEGDCSRVTSSCLYQMNLDYYPEYKGIKLYGKLFEALAKVGIVPIGIYRGLLNNMKFGTMSNTMPYVYTNPDKDTELFSTDRIFVLSTAPVRDDGYKDIKTWLLKLQMKSKLDEKKQGLPTAATSTSEVVTAQNKVIEKRISKVQESVNRRLTAVIKAVEQCCQKLDALERGGGQSRPTSAMNTSRSNDSFRTDYLYDIQSDSGKSLSHADTSYSGTTGRQRTESGISIDESITSDEGGGGGGGREERSFSFDSSIGASPRYSRPVSSQKLITIEEAHRYRNRRRDVKSDSDDDSEFSPDHHHQMKMIQHGYSLSVEDNIEVSEGRAADRMVVGNDDDDDADDSICVRANIKESQSPTVGILRKYLNDSNCDSPARPRRNSSVRIVEDEKIYQLQRKGYAVGDGEGIGYESCDDVMEQVICDEVESILKEHDVAMNRSDENDVDDDHDHGGGCGGGGDDAVEKIDDVGKYEEEEVQEYQMEMIQDGTDNNNDNSDLCSISINSDINELDATTDDLRTTIKPDGSSGKYSHAVGILPLLEAQDSTMLNSESQDSMLKLDYSVDRPATRGPSVALTKGRILNPDRMAMLRGDRSSGPITINTPTHRPNSIYPSVSKFISTASRMRPLSASVASSMTSLGDSGDNSNSNSNSRVHFIRPASANDLSSREDL